MLWLYWIGAIRFQIPLSIAVIGAASREIFGLAGDDDSLRAVELDTNSSILLPWHTAAACGAIGPAADTVLHRPIKDISAVQ